MKKDDQAAAVPDAPALPKSVTVAMADLAETLRERGLDVTPPVLVVIDGAKALAAAVRAGFDHPVIQRCQLHKVRNVTDRLPDGSARRSPSGCGPPTTPSPRCRRSPSSKPSPPSWPDGTTALRWCAAGMAEAAKQFRRVNGHLHLLALRCALDAHIAKTVTPDSCAAVVA